MASEAEFTEFVRGHIRTVWAVEVLLLLMSDPGRGWSAAELERELRANHHLVAAILKGFYAGGLAICDEEDRCRFAPASPLMDELCRQLQAAYQERPVWVTNLIASAPSPLENLANAFRFKSP